VLTRIHVSLGASAIGPDFAVGQRPLVEFLRVVEVALTGAGGGQVAQDTRVRGSQLPGVQEDPGRLVVAPAAEQDRTEVVQGQHVIGLPGQGLAEVVLGLDQVAQGLLRQGQQPEGLAGRGGALHQRAEQLEGGARLPAL
jgi:hypothetical protein